MNTNLQIFNNTEFGNVTTIEMNNEVWFLGKEIAEILGYKATRNALKDHIDEEDVKVLKYKACTDLMQSNLWGKNDFSDKKLINESGLYSLILNSKMPSAKKFKHWVTSEVLPSIRKTGSYSVIENNKDKLLLQLFSNDPLEVATAHKQLVEMETKPLLETIEEQTPKVEVYDNFVDKEHTLGFRELRKELESTLDITINENRFKDVMREYNLIGKRVKATAFAIRNGFAVTKDIDLANGGTTTQDRFTMKTRDLLLGRYRNN